MEIEMHVTKQEYDEAGLVQVLTRPGSTSR
jgi:YD repeat-containing protein